MSDDERLKQIRQRTSGGFYSGSLRSLEASYDIAFLLSVIDAHPSSDDPLPLRTFIRDTVREETAEPFKRIEAMVKTLVIALVAEGKGPQS